MSTFLLKLIALSTMIIDHFGAIFHEDVMIYRMIGRLAFPIYCFLLVEGFYHTSNVKRYAIRLLIFGFISELFFDYAFYGKIYLWHQNIFFTLFIGLMAMYFIENKDGKYNIKKNLVMAISILIATLTFVDYTYIGIIYILAFYFFRDYPKKQKFLRIGLIMLIINLVSTSLIQQFSLLALPILYFYNGELGIKNKALQLLFYIAYPLHLLIFYLIKIY
ncbi:MAG TPA: TraX family protein [Tissierellaceae bacterium]